MTNVVTIQAFTAFMNCQMLPAHLDKQKPVCVQLVQKTVEDAFPGAVVRVHAVYDTARLEPLAAEYEQTARRLADLLDDYTSKLRRHRSVKRRKVPLAPCQAVDCLADLSGRHLASRK